MFFGPRGPVDEIPLGEAPLPSDKKARVQVPCGPWLDWDEASWHYLDCDECDQKHRERNFESQVMG